MLYLFTIILFSFCNIPKLLQINTEKLNPPPQKGGKKGKKGKKGAAAQKKNSKEVLHNLLHYLWCSHHLIHDSSHWTEST